MSPRGWLCRTELNPSIFSGMWRWDKCAKTTFIQSEAYWSWCCLESGRSCPSMFSQVLDTLLAVVFPSHGIISLSFLLLFHVCLLGFLFFQRQKDGFPKFFVKFPMNGVGKFLSAVIFLGFCSWWYLILLWLFVNSHGGKRWLWTWGFLLVVAVSRCREYWGEDLRTFG